MVDNSVIAAERRRRIYELALQEGSVSVSRLATQLGVVENTIRRDLDFLHAEGKVIRSHGGATVKTDSSPRPPYSETRYANVAQKSWIGAAAVEYLPSSGFVFINAGTTTKQLVVRIPRETHLTIYTNSADISASLASGTSADVFLMGGRIIRDSLETDGTSCQSVDDLYWDTAFIGIAALDVDHGFTGMFPAVAAMERRVIENSRRTIALCDSSKLGTFGNVRVAPVNSIDLLITDSGASNSLITQFIKAGVHVVLVGESGVVDDIPAAEKPRRGRRHE